ncbi:hypothetical protein JCM14076_23330 [Methylosoma difficile]
MKAADMAEVVRAVDRLAEGIMVVADQEEIVVVVIMAADQEEIAAAGIVAAGMKVTLAAEAITAVGVAVIGMMVTGAVADTDMVAVVTAIPAAMAEPPDLAFISGHLITQPPITIIGIKHRITHQRSSPSRLRPFTSNNRTISSFRQATGITAITRLATILTSNNVGVLGNKLNPTPPSSVKEHSHAFPF